MLPSVAQRRNNPKQASIHAAFMYIAVAHHVSKAHYCRVAKRVPTWNV